MTNYFNTINKNNTDEIYLNNFSNLFIRDEISLFEFRTPLTPIDVKYLIELNNFTVYVQSSNKRIYNDEEYEKSGAIITPLKWHDPFFDDKNILIIGLKNIDNEYQYLNNHKHLYFSHSFKKQENSDFILKSFKESNSIIFDFEYFSTFNGIKYERLISFGFYSGVVGGFLGIFFKILEIETEIETEINNRNNNSCSNNYLDIHLKPWLNIDSMLSSLNNIMNINIIKKLNISIGIIGANGRCGTGVRHILDMIGLPYTVIDKNFDKNKFVDFDIFYNCILLDTNYKETFFDEHSLFYKNIFIIDISCDNTASNNPIRLYKNNTTWDNPLFKYNDLCHIISIPNLPSLLPKDSSDYFSNICRDLLINFDINYFMETDYGKDYDKKSIINQAWKYTFKKFISLISDL